MQRLKMIEWCTNIIQHFRFTCTNIAHKMIERVGRGGKGGQVVVMHVHCGSSLLPAAPPPMQPSRQPDTSSWPHTHTPPLPLLASPTSDFSFRGLSAWWGEGAGAPRQASPPPLCVRGLCWTGCCSDLVRTHRVRQPPFNTCCSVFFPQIIFGHLKTFAISIHKSTLSVALYKVPL